MKNRFTVLALAMALCACNKAPAPGDAPAVTTAPAEADKPPVFESTPLSVAADQVTQQDPAVLAGAAWTTKQCALTVAGDAAAITAAAQGPTQLTGFFIAPDDTPAGSFEIVLKGDGANYSIPVRTGWDRTDVADYFKLPQLATSGFDASIDLSGVPAGSYEVDYMLDRAGAKHFCESGKKLVVESGAAAPTVGTAQPSEEAPAATDAAAEPAEAAAAPAAG